MAISLTTVTIPFLEPYCENIEKKNIKARKNDELHKIKPLVTKIYTIQANCAGDKRISAILDADETMIKYSSEYHYLFQMLLNQEDATRFSIEEAFMFSNAARKVLETFVRFKFPKYRGDFRTWLKKAIETSVTQKDNEELIYKFINKYSHSQGFDGDSVDNQLGESQNVVKNILSLIEEVDSTHYNEMREICNP